MNKWIIIALVVAGAYWFYTQQKGKAGQMTARAEAAPAAQGAPSRTPTGAQCREVGGRIIEGMGCVVGAPDTPANPGVSPDEMASVCQSLNQKYVREINACVSG